MTTIIDKTREAVSDRLNPAWESLEQNVREARRAVARGRRAAEDYADEAALQVRRHPLSALGIAVTTGILAGCVMGFLMGRRGGHRTPQAQ